IDGGDNPPITKGALNVGRGVLTIAQITAMLAPSAADRALARCTDAPLLAQHSGPPCTIDGKADIAGDGALDCWRATRIGAAAAPPLEWDLELGCRDPKVLRIPLLGDEIEYQLAREEVPGRTRAWLIEKLVGAARDPALAILHAAMVA